MVPFLSGQMEFKSGCEYLLKWSLSGGQSFVCLHKDYPVMSFFSAWSTWIWRQRKMPLILKSFITWGGYARILCTARHPARSCHIPQVLGSGRQSASDKINRQRDESNWSWHNTNARTANRLWCRRLVFSTQPKRKGTLCLKRWYNPRPEAAP